MKRVQKIGTSTVAVNMVAPGRTNSAKSPALCQARMAPNPAFLADGAATVSLPVWVTVGDRPGISPPGDRSAKRLLGHLLVLLVEVGDKGLDVLATADQVADRSRDFGAEAGWQRGNPGLFAEHWCNGAAFDGLVVQVERRVVERRQVGGRVISLQRNEERVEAGSAVGIGLRELDRPFLGERHVWRAGTDGQ